MEITLLDLKYEYKYNKFNVSNNVMPKIGVRNSSSENSKIFCSKNPLFGFSLKGGTEYFIKYNYYF